MLTRRTALSYLTAAPAWIKAATGFFRGPAGEPTGVAPLQPGSTNGERIAAFRLSYNSPAHSFVETLPIGNGFVGASIFGGIDREHLALNEVTLWSGEPKDWNNPEARSILPEVRRLLFARRWAEAENLCRRMQGPYTQAYLPMGDLYLRFEHGAPSTAEVWKEAPGITARSGLAGRSYLLYSRTLDLKTAMATVSYHLGGTEYRREFFASYPDRAMVIRLTASNPGRISFAARMDSLLRYRTSAETDTYVMQGKAPKHAEPNYEDIDPPILYADDDNGPGMRFETLLRAIASGGKVFVDHDGIHVQAADEVVLLLSAATSFNGYDKSPSREGRDTRPIAKTAIDQAARKTYEQLRETHLADYRQLFDRVELNLGRQRLESGEPNPEYLALMFHYARYKLIAASRAGGQPVTLGGGMWDDSVRPPWSYNYTINENTQKQYSQVEAANLSECAEPYIDFMRGLAANGTKTAQINYGFKGWVAHHNTDLWRQSAPVGRYGDGDVSWANFMAGGIWLCENLYNHYSFNGDTEFLGNSCYPILKGAAEFALDWLVEDPNSGLLVTAPSTSPEARYLLPGGESGGVSIATAADMSLIWELFKNTIESARILGVDDAFRLRLERAQTRLQPLKVGSKGQILEWYEEYPERDPHHRHASHLLGVSWGSRISKRGTPELFAAARRAFELRGPGANLPDKTALAARLEDGEAAYRSLPTARLPDGSRVLSILEMLVQSHLNEIHLLPALPSAWPEGYLRGVKARGGYLLDFEWRDGKLLKSIIRSRFAGKCRVRTSVPVTLSVGPKLLPCENPEPTVIEFRAEAGGNYQLTRA